MRTSALFVALVLCWATTAFSQGFKLTAVSPRENAGVVTLFISTSGTPPVNVTARDKWKVSVAQGASSLLLESATSTATDPFSAIRYNTTTEQVEIDISRANLANIAVDKAGWQAGFFGAGAMSVAAKAEVTPGVNLKPAKSKDDSDIYVLGALIAGSATKPIWMVDAKGSIGWPTGALYHWFGVGGTFQVNPGAKPPADSSDVNPDSITFFSQMDTLQQHSFLKGFIYGYRRSSDRSAASTRARRRTATSPRPVSSRCFRSLCCGIASSWIRSSAMSSVGTCGSQRSSSGGR